MAKPLTVMACVAVNGEAFDGNGLFKFALVNADGTTTYWSNDGTSVDGSEPQASVAVPVNGGLYSILLGNTAQPGMGAIDPALFAQHNDAKLRVWFSDGVNGFQQLSPDRPFASVPYAFSAGIAGSVNITNGSITKSMLGEEILSDLNRTITKQMLGQDVLSDLSRIVTPEMIQASSITTSQLNEQILKYLKPEITDQPQPQTVYGDSNVSFSVTAEGKYLTYQWKKNGVDIVGETNATFNITDANATLHDGNYSVVVSNDFGSELTDSVSLAIMHHPTKLWIAFSENGNTSGKYSPFWELNVTEKKPLLVDNLNFSLWNDYVVPNNNGLESITTNTTFDKDKHVFDGSDGVFFPFSTSAFGVPSTFTEYFGTDVQKMIDELHGVSITQYEAPAPGGNTVTRWKIETELDLNYTKFTFADPDHETAIASWMASASVANLVEIVITESVDRPDIDNLTDEQIANTFNSPKLSLKCGDIWTGDLDIPVEQ
jgi:hypothetical protein